MVGGGAIVLGIANAKGEEHGQQNDLTQQAGQCEEAWSSSLFSL
jgi:hypothetical protein